MVINVETYDIMDNSTLISTYLPSSRLDPSNIVSGIQAIIGPPGIYGLQVASYAGNYGIPILLPSSPTSKQLTTGNTAAAYNSTFFILPPPVCISIISHITA